MATSKLADYPLCDLLSKPSTEIDRVFNDLQPKLDHRPSLYTMNELEGMSGDEIELESSAFKFMQELLVLRPGCTTDEDIEAKANEVICRGNMHALLNYFENTFNATNLSLRNKTIFRMSIRASRGVLDMWGPKFYNWEKNFALFEGTAIAQLAVAKGYTLPAVKIERLRVANHDKVLKMERERFDAMLETHKADLAAGRISPNNFGKVAFMLVGSRVRTGGTPCTMPVTLGAQEKKLMEYLWDPTVSRASN